MSRLTCPGEVLQELGVIESLNIYCPSSTMLLLMKTMCYRNLQKRLLMIVFQLLLQMSRGKL